MQEKLVFTYSYNSIEHINKSLFKVSRLVTLCLQVYSTNHKGRLRLYSLMLSDGKANHYIEIEHNQKMKKDFAS